MAQKKTIIGCNKFNASSSISNSNWSNQLKESLTLNGGDTISVKTSFIDTRNKQAGYYTVPKDVILEMEYYFYYINRGGNNVVSNQIQGQSQSLACDIAAPNVITRNFDNGHEIYAFPLPKPNADNTTFPLISDGTISFSAYDTATHTSMRDIVLPLTNDTTETGKIPQNLTPLLESIYHCHGNNNIASTKTQYYTKDGVFNQSAFLNNPSGFNTTLDVNSGDGLPYLLHYYVPENVYKNYVPENVDIDDLNIGDIYSILDLGDTLNDGSYTTNFINLSTTLTTPTVGVNFTVANLNVNRNITDYTLITSNNNIIITNSNGFDFSQYGGPSLPVQNNPNINLQENVLMDRWYSLISFTPAYVDGTFIPDLAFYLGSATAPTSTTQFIAAQNFDITTYPAKSPILKTSLNNINIGMNIEVITQGTIYWDAMGFNSNLNNPTISPFDITANDLNIAYYIIDKGLTYGNNNQYFQLDLPLITGAEVFSPTAIIPQKNISFVIIDTSDLIQSTYIGQYFIITDMGGLTPEQWLTLGDFASGTAPAINNIFTFNNILTTPLVGGKIQEIILTGIPVGTPLEIPTIGNIEILLSFMGYINGSGTSFTTTAELTMDNIDNINISSIVPLTGSITFTTPDTKIQNYVINTPFNFIVQNIYTAPDFTDATNNWTANLIKNDVIMQINNYPSFPLPVFKPTNSILTNVIASPIFASDLIGSAVFGEEIQKTNAYDNKALNTGVMKPFTKKFKFKLKKGTYNPNYLAEIISRGMSIQKPKQNIINNKIQISTPINNINHQMLDTQTLTTQVNSQTEVDFPPPNFNTFGNYNGMNGLVHFSNDPNVFQVLKYPFQHTLMHGGGFPYTATGQIDTWANLPEIWQNYIPNNNFTPKNKDILPEGQNLDETELPINPKYSDNDFNYNQLITGDDTPFLYRPNAYGTRSDYAADQMNIKLTYNDANLDYLNSTIQQFGKLADDSIKNIEMAYKPLCNDVSSGYFENIQRTLNLEETTDYSIRPVVSVPYCNLADVFPTVSGITPPDPPNYTFSTETGISNITSPLVGTSQMSLSFNNENNNLFSFEYLHSPIYSKVDPTTTATQESIGIYNNTSYIPTSNTTGDNLTYKPVKSIFQCESQSGILLKNLKATYIDGTESTFWQDLGFNIDSITINNNKSTLDSDTFQIPYNDFLNKSTRGFCGTSNIYDTQTKSDTNEISPISYYDSYNMSGYMVKTNIINNPANTVFTNNYQLYTNPLYFEVQTTKSIDAQNNFSNLNDTGHVLLSIEGYGGQLINDATKLNIKSIVSSYYSSSNFITNSIPESIVYQHQGEPLDLNNLKIVLIDPYTNSELENIGPNSSLYLEITQSLGIQNQKK